MRYRYYFATLALSLSGVSHADPWDMEKANTLANAAKCAYEADAQAALRCLQESSPTFAKLTADQVWLWKHPLRPDGYLLVNHPDRLILAIRGTMPPVKPSLKVALDWLNDILVGVGSELQDGYHKGFYESWKGMRASLKSDKTPIDWLAQRGGRPLYIVGHSKGGAIATIATLDMTKNAADFGLKQVPTETYEFEPARSITQPLADENRAVFNNTWRFEYKDDIVPHVPLKNVDGTSSSFINKLDDYAKNLGFPAFESVGRLYYVDEAGTGQAVSPEVEANLFAMRNKVLVDHILKLKGHGKTLEDFVEASKENCTAALSLVDDHIVYWQWIAQAKTQSGEKVSVGNDKLTTLASHCAGGLTSRLKSDLHQFNQRIFGFGLRNATAR